jgi:hypothetical protein
VRKLPPAPKLERDAPAWPPDRKLVLHENGCLQNPIRHGMAYCPNCMLDMHPSYYPKHKSTPGECEFHKMDLIEEIMKT